MTDFSREEAQPLLFALAQTSCNIDIILYRIAAVLLDLFSIFSALALTSQEKYTRNASVESLRGRSKLKGSCSILQSIKSMSRSCHTLRE